MIEPGLLSLSPEQYHRDELAPEPSLSSSIVKVLLNATPAHARDRHPRLTTAPEYAWPNSDAMKLGSVCHAMLLGAGSKYVCINPADYPTKDGSPGKTLGTAAAKAAVADAESRGLIVIDPDTYRDALNVTERMQAAIAEEFPTWDAGYSEQVMFWRRKLVDGSFINARAMADRMLIRCTCPARKHTHRHLFDLKFSGKLTPQDKLAAQVGIDGWDVQQVFYTDGAETLFPAEKGNIPCTFIIGETFPPYETRFLNIPDGTVRVDDEGNARLVSDWLAITKGRVAQACEVWGACLRTGTWPGYSRWIVASEPPNWLLDQWMKSLGLGDE